MDKLRVLRRLGNVGLLLAIIVACNAKSTHTNDSPKSAEGSVSKVELKAEDRNALATIAQYTSSTPSQTAQALSRIGYEPGIAPETFHNYPAIRQIAEAWRDAEIARPGQGGEALLAALSRDLAMRYTGLSTEPTLKVFLDTTVPSLPLPFGRTSPAQPIPSLPAAARAAITTLAQYTSSGALGSQQHILVKYFSITDDQAFETLSMREYSDAMMYALSLNPEHSHHNIVTQLTHDVATHYSAAREEPSLKPFLFEWSPPTAVSRAPGSPAPAPAPTPAPEPPSHPVADEPRRAPRPPAVEEETVECYQDCINGVCGPWVCPPGVEPP